MKNEAIRWAVRRGIGALSPEEQAQFEAWLAGDERRAGALMRADAALALTARAHALKPIEIVAAAPSRRHVIGWSAGAAIAAGIAGVMLVPTGSTLSTRTGEIRRTRLADASTVMLNTQSRLTVDLEPHERRIALDDGEAWFQVAHDRTRPFIVSAADVRVRAVGTAFSVRRLPGGADVLVTEGKVEVWRADRPAERVAIASGRRAFVPDDDVGIVSVKARAAIDRALAWRVGRLSLTGESLDYAVTEMNRYNDMQLRIDDPELGRRPVVGYFEVNDPVGFAHSIASVEDAHVEVADRRIRIVPNGS